MPLTFSIINTKDRTFQMTFLSGLEILREFTLRTSGLLMPRPSAPQTKLKLSKSSTKTVLVNVNFVQNKI